MLKVYFTAATSFDGELNVLYKKIFLILKKEFTVISGQQIIDKSLLEEDKHLTSKEIYTREKRYIDEADLVIAEVSRPSLGVGSEIVYALSNHKPVLALVHSGYEDRISPIISGNPSENLFLEFYTLSTLPAIIKNIKNYVKTVKNFRKPKGKLIIIDGSDGSGKTTQTELLVAALKKKNIPVRHYDFPQYYRSFHGATVAKFLRGEFGKIDKVSPYLASLAYALDRLSVKKEMEEFLKRGYLIIANRYATSNMAHQGAKIFNLKQKNDYLKWIYELEYQVHQIPKEDLVIYLYVPWKTTLKLTKKKGVRGYLKGRKDIHENNVKHLMATEKMYLELASKYKHWVKIDCVKDGKLLSKEEIHKKVVGEINHQILKPSFV